MKTTFMEREETDNTKCNPVTKIIEIIQMICLKGNSLLKAFCLSVASCVLPRYDEYLVFRTTGGTYTSCGMQK